MATKKQDKTKLISRKKLSVQDKIDEIKLEAHVDAIKKGKHTDVVEEIKFRAGNVRNATNEAVKWAKKEKLGKQTKKFVDLLVDGIAVFLENLVEDKR
ncbi:MAG: hypothetical protein LBS76_04205 [Mycoplasmataceae bacterium]|jgi:excinuclease UvrABC ATPase subunit|nr:hypothetical protein [Mycoplasmataceae bacterium]